MIFNNSDIINVFSRLNEIISDDDSVKKSMNILNHFDIPVIFKSDFEYELDKIRKITLTA